MKFFKGQIAWNMEYDLLWDINNGKTLCKECHKLTNNYLRNKKLNDY